MQGVGALTPCSEPVSLLALPAGEAGGGGGASGGGGGGSGAVRVYNTLPKEGGAEVICEIPAHKSPLVRGPGGGRGRSWLGGGGTLQVECAVEGLHCLQAKAVRQERGIAWASSSASAYLIPARAAARPQGLLAWSADGTLLASASQKGTVVRVHAFPSAHTTHVLRRGTSAASICAMAFGPPPGGGSSTVGSTMGSTARPQLLCVASDHGTIHVFRLLPPPARQALCRMHSAREKEEMGAKEELVSLWGFNLSAAPKPVPPSCAPSQAPRRRCRRKPASGSDAHECGAGAGVFSLGFFMLSICPAFCHDTFVMHPCFALNRSWCRCGRC